jgi:hypothetical protein
MSNETYYTVSKDTYYIGKRDLLYGHYYGVCSHAEKTENCFKGL